MLATGLGIIKIIGIILLGIMGIILAVILLVLLVPIRYRIEGSRYEKVKVSVRVGWLLHILSFRITYDGELVTIFKIFGIRIKSRPDKAADINTAADITGETTGKMTGKYAKEPLKESDIDQPLEQPPEDVEASADSEQERFNDQSRDGAGKKPFSFAGIYDRLKDIKEKAGAFIAIIRQEEKVLKLLWKRFKMLLLHILPRRVRGKIRFGFEDPYVTGQILTYISPFYGAYARRLQVIPVFEEPVLDGEITMTGRIRIGTFLWIAILLWREPDIRRIWKQWHG